MDNDMVMSQQYTLNPISYGYARAARQYEESRPDYPPELVTRLQSIHPIDAETSVLDLAAGTGKLSRLLLRTGCRITAVEPQIAMRSTMRQLLPDVTIVEGSAEAIPLPDRSVDVVVIGEAFHWFDAPVAWRELRRVVRPGGLVAAVWLHRNVASWQQLLLRYLSCYARSVPAAEGPSNPSLNGFLPMDFGPLQEWNFKYVLQYDIRKLIGMYDSYSFISSLPDAERARVLNDIERLVFHELEIAPHETFPLPLQLQMWATVRSRVGTSEAFV